MTRRPRQRNAPPAPPHGYIWFYWKLTPIAAVERQARLNMGNHDQQPRAQRDRNNADTLTGPARHYQRSSRRPQGRT
jgi:hypothetical protein